jgi:hypothetical protein
MYQYLVIGRDKSYFVKTIKNNLIININRTMSFKCWICLSTTYLSCLVHGFFNKLLVFQWVRIVIVFLYIVVDLFQNAYEANFFHGLLKNKDSKLAQI